MSWREAAELTRLWMAAADAAKVGRGVTPAQVTEFEGRLKEWVEQIPDGQNLLYIWVTVRVAAGLRGLADTMMINACDLDTTIPDMTKPE